MSFTDLVPGIIVIGFILIAAWGLYDYVWQTTMPAINQTGNQEVMATLDSGWDKNVQFTNNTFMAIMIIVALISVILTVMLQSHPVILIIWLLLNIIGLLIFDALNAYLTVFSGGSFNTGAMADALNFYQTGMPKLLVLSNMLMGVIMLGKRWLYG